MRDPNRINVILAKIEAILKASKDKSIGKLLVLAGADPAVYYTEDNELISKIKEKLSLSELEPTELTNENLLRISKVWIHLPDLRFGQLICNIFAGEQGNEYLKEISDENLAEIVEKYYLGETDNEH